MEREVASKLQPFANLQVDPSYYEWPVQKVGLTSAAKLHVYFTRHSLRAEPVTLLHWWGLSGALIPKLQELHNFNLTAGVFQATRNHGI